MLLAISTIDSEFFDLDLTADKRNVAKFEISKSGQIAHSMIVKAILSRCEIIKRPTMRLCFCLCLCRCRNGNVKIKRHFRDKTGNLQKYKNKTLNFRNKLKAYL